MANADLEMGALAKPARGSLFLARAEKKRSVKRYEEQEKSAVRARDGKRCRWPNCRPQSRLEVAHLEGKRMGGDHSLRSYRRNLIHLCYLHHQGPTSLHSQDLRIEPLTDKGTDGPCAFYELNRETGNWQHIGTERER